MKAKITAMYQQSGMAVKWKVKVKRQIAPWVEEKGKSYWDFVRFFLFYKGILKYLSREDFALWLTTECADSIDESDTRDSLNQIMCKYKYKSDIRRRTKAERKHGPDKEFQFDLIPDSSVSKILYRELDKLCSIELEDEPLTECDKLKKNLKRFVAQKAGKQPFAKVFEHPEYCGFRPEVSIEYYMNDTLAEERDATFIQIYEMTNEPLTKDVVTQFAGRYMDLKFAKLVVTTTFGIDNATRRAAKDRKVSILRINPNCDITDDDFLLSRHVGVVDKQEHDLAVMTGKSPMTTPYLIMDEYGITSSLPDFLNNQGLPVESGMCLKAPYITDTDIKVRANSFILEKIANFTRAFTSTNKPLDFDADPFQIAEKMGYKVKRNWIEESTQLGSVNFKEHIITLNFRPNTNLRRMLFTLAHELGHIHLHSGLNVEDFTDTEQTLFSSKLVLGNEYKWLEHHANYFASCLLMPEDVVGYLYSYYCQKIFGRGIIQPIFIDPYDYNKEKIFLRIARPMAKHMKVSVEALRIRFFELGLAIKPHYFEGVHETSKLSDVLRNVR